MAVRADACDILLAHRHALPCREQRHPNVCGRDLRRRRRRVEADAGKCHRAGLPWAEGSDGHREGVQARGKRGRGVGKDAAEKKAAAIGGGPGRPCRVDSTEGRGGCQRPCDLRARSAYERFAISPTQR